MSPQNIVKKGIKAKNANKGIRVVQRQPAISTTSTRMATTAIPTLMTSASPPTLKTVWGPSGEPRTVKKWCFDRTAVYFSAREVRPSTQLIKGTVVELTGRKEMISDADMQMTWSEIVYKIHNLRTGTQWVTGWVNDLYLDDYNEKFPDSGVVIRSATPDQTDAPQNMILEGKTRYNMCGPLCVAWIVKDDIDSVLAQWKNNSPIAYNNVFAGGKDSGTSEIDLKKMLGAVLGAYGYRADNDQILMFREKLTFPVSRASMVKDLEKMLATHTLIVLATIDKSGRLIGNNEPPQIQHWIALDKITGNGNRLEIYNPFPNKREEYSFNEFYRSCRSSWSGIWVKRKDQPQFLNSSMETLPKFHVTIEKPNPSYLAAQYLDIDGKKQTNLCGEFCVSFLVKDSIENVLKRWKETQPNLYADTVGKNSGTGTFDLTTILSMYGYNNEGDVLDFAKGLTDPYLKKYLHSPGRMAEKLKAYFLIAGVNIDGTTGKLKPGNDVRHWVVVDKIEPVGKTGGWVGLYNPFPNSWEEYAYREFENSVGVLNWSGLWVKRSIVPMFVQPVVQNPRGASGDVQSRNPERQAKPGQWSEGQVRAMIKQQSSRGIPINKIAANLSEKSGWKKEDILHTFKKSSQSATSGKWAETQLLREIEKRRAAGEPAHKIASALTGQSGWKRQEILVVIRKTERAGGGEKWTEEQMVSVIQEQFKMINSPNKITAALMEGSGWKNWEIRNLLKTMNKTEEKKGGSKPRVTMEVESLIAVDPETIVQASKPWADFLKWQDSLIAQNPKLHRVLPWGHPAMIKHGFDVEQSTPSNFQAVNLYNDGNKEFGAVSSFIRISHKDVMRLKALQIEDQYKAKKEDWRRQKMNYLCKFRGTVYFFDEESDQWHTASRIRWGTLALGGNLVQAEGTQTIRTKIRDSDIVNVEIARLKGFRASDWGRPLDELLAEGLVHRCFCAYHHNHFGDSPKGIIYSPFYSMQDWDFSGAAQATALYIPTEWLSREPSETLNLER